MPHELIHNLPMRWADLDELGHVNNVTYVDYACEARDAHVAAGELTGLEIRSATVEFLRPLLLSERPVRVTSRLVDGSLVQEIAPDGASAPFARVTSRAEAAASEPVGEGAQYALRIRHSDLDARGAVTLTRMFELAQESRIVALRRLHADHGAFGRFVVARVDVALDEAITWRPEPYVARTAVTKVGRKSFTLGTAFEGGRLGHSRAVLVGFDLQTQQSRVLDDVERKILSQGC